MRCRHQERLWKEYQRDPSRWWDLRKSKTNSGAPDFKHKFTQEFLWLEGIPVASASLEERTTLNISIDFCARTFKGGKEAEAEKGKEQLEKTKVGSVPDSSIWASLTLQEIVPTSKDCVLQPCVLSSSLNTHSKKENDSAQAEHVHTYASGVYTLVGNELSSPMLAIDSISAPQKRLNTSWSDLILYYTKCGKTESALRLYRQMENRDFDSLSGPSVVALIKACSKLKAIEIGHQLHAELARSGLLERDLFVGTSLLDLYVDCGCLAKAQELFDKLHIRDVVTWNALLAGYIKWGHANKALECLKQMQMDGIAPDGVTYVLSLKACISLRGIGEGLKVHSEVERRGFLKGDLFVSSMLVDMYAKCGLLMKAQEVLESLPSRDVVCWTALITGYSEHGFGEECLHSLQKMHSEGLAPNDVTFICCLRACGRIGAIEQAVELHAEIERRGLLEKGQLLGSTLVDTYGKCGSTHRAQEVFNMLPVKNVVAWTALIAGYAEHGHGEEALNCLEKMQGSGFAVDTVAFLCSLKACGCVGAIDKGLSIHAEVEKRGLSITDQAVGNALIDMYARCGSLSTAHHVFDNLSVKGIVSWNSLIAGYAQHGDSARVFRLFERMLKDDLKPDLVTFVIVLDVCSQAGLQEKGEEYFNTMSKDYDILPVLEHHTCMLDLLGRAGLLEKAVSLIKRLPIGPDLAVWHSVLGACKKWGNVELGREAFEQAVHLDEKDGAAYVLMASIYAGANMEEEARSIKALRAAKIGAKGRIWPAD